MFYIAGLAIGWFLTTIIALHFLMQGEQEIKRLNALLKKQ